MNSPLLSQPNVDSAHDGPDPRDKKKYYFADTLQRRKLIAFARALFRPIMQMKARIRKSAPRRFRNSRGKPYDQLRCLSHSVCPTARDLFMGTSELFGNLIMDLLIRNLSGFPVNRGDTNQWTMRHAFRVLKHGHTLGMFSEGGGRKDVD
jgi:hypothetical protein